MKSHKFFRPVLLGLMTLALVACDLRELLDPIRTHFIRVYINENLPNVTMGFYRSDYTHPAYRSPELLKLLICNPESGQVIEERYLRDRGSDAKGAYYEGYVMCDAARYQLLIYSYGSEWTVVRGETNLFETHAYTNPVSLDMRGFLALRSNTDTVYVNPPEHLFTQSTPIEVPISLAVDTLRASFQANAKGVTLFKSFSAPDAAVDTRADDDSELTYSAYADMSLNTLSPLLDPTDFCVTSRVKTYYLQIRFKGLPFISHVQGLVSGLSAGVRLHDGQMDAQPVSVAFDMEIGDTQGDEGVLYGSFPTFGLPPDWTPEKGLKLTLGITAVNGGMVGLTLDIGREFAAQASLEHQWILIDRMVTVTPPPPGSGQGDGGFQPSVVGWSEVVVPIEI